MQLRSGKDREILMVLIGFLLVLFLLLGLAYLVFRIIVRGDYQRRGRLSAVTSALELLMFMAVFCFPFIYSDTGWGWFWSSSAPVGSTRWITGMLVVGLGFLASFGTMFWFGLRRAFGVQVEGLVRSGPYRFSRNPQVLGGFLLVLGCCLIWPSWYNLGWILLYAFTAHMMVVTEEEHLKDVFGEEYEVYCRETPRYLFF